MNFSVMVLLTGLIVAIIIANPTKVCEDKIVSSEKVLALAQVEPSTFTRPWSCIVRTTEGHRHFSGPYMCDGISTGDLIIKKKSCHSNQTYEVREHK